RTIDGSPSGSRCHLQLAKLVANEETCPKLHSNSRKMNSLAQRPNHCATATPQRFQNAVYELSEYILILKYNVSLLNKDENEALSRRTHRQIDLSANHHHDENIRKCLKAVAAAAAGDYCLLCTVELAASAVSHSLAIPPVSLACLCDE
ncbi:unnamed protein product, partial [Soboliphyme baturini]|uniref:BHLH domain-containing protein n=1 Tax=Soboliphyme baturini TaxID=241478 RepID=A0A183IRI0_9BILA